MPNNKKKGSNTKDKVQEAFELIEQGIKDITSSDKYKEFLTFSANFYQYSFRNQILIWIQKPNASFVAGFAAWKKMGRSVKKGEKGIRILAPMRITASKENEEGKMEENELLLFRTISVFDISQTDGEPIPSIAEFVDTVSGETELYEMVRGISPFPVEELEDCKGADGYYRIKEKDIKINSKNPTSHRLLTLIHEMAHGLLHHDRQNIPTKRVREIEAETVGFVVCHALGVDTSVNSIGYLASYGGRSTMKFVEASKERINRTAKKILTDFENRYMVKENLEEVSVL